MNTVFRVAVIQSHNVGGRLGGFARLALGLLIFSTGCNLKFPGPKFNFDTPDAAIWGNFAGSGAPGFPGAGNGGQAVTPGASRSPSVIESLVSVNGSAPLAACPPGHLAADGTCRPRSGLAAQCPQGGSKCSSGKCCPAGFTCGTGGGCERTAGGASFAQPALCASGQLVTSENSNCPALTASNAFALHARCCPAGAIFRCMEEGNAESAVCMLEALVSPTCPGGYTALTDTRTSERACCLATGGPLQLTNGNCLYAEASAPQCNGTVDAATGACCGGSFTSTGRCCAGGHQACGNGCCELGESCDQGNDQCISAQPAAAPACPAEAPRDCSSSGGQCCPGNTQCQPDGSCSCPTNTPVDCGGFCAISSEQCTCPSEHPDACGAQCCLRGGCGAAGAGAAASCGCPAATIACGASCCPSGSSCVNGQCLQCPSDAPSLCGSNCCALGQNCMNGQCVGGCGGDTPVQCGSSCCHAGDACNGGSCVSQQGEPQQSSSNPAASDAGTPRASGSGGGSAPGSSAEKSCQPIPASCSMCKVSACASASSSGGCQGWYEASDGKKFECKACNDCVTAATAALAHCCPLHL